MCRASLELTRPKIMQPQNHNIVVHAGAEKEDQPRTTHLTRFAFVKNAITCRRHAELKHHARAFA